MLKLASVSVGYGGALVNRAVSMEVGKSEILALIGRNGVGKSTLAKAIIGLVPTLSGTIELDGQKIGHLPAQTRARLGIGYVPQGRGIFGDLTVEDNLSVGRLVSESPRDLEYAFDLFPILKERRLQLGGTLSGGQQQMLSIARVLLGMPRMLLLDEPSDGIQPNIVEQIGELCLRLNREQGLAVLLIEQNLDLIITCAHRCLVMEKGSITSTLAPQDLENPEVARLALAI
jgi:ABC-type branched-subunit amino acid transport system ATPase component